MLFKIIFVDVVHFEVHPRDNEIPIEEDDCLSEMVFSDYFEFIFMSGMRIVINSKKVYFET